MTTNKNKEEVVGELTKITILTCERCHYIWYPRKPEKPKVCPNCNSRIWQKPKTEKKQQG